MLQCTWDAKKLLFKKGWFGTFVFPMRWLMLMIAPLAFFVGCLSLVGFGFTVNWLLGLGMLLLFSSPFVLGLVKENFLSSFVWHQYYLLVGLYKMFKPNYLWKPIKREKLK